MKYLESSNMNAIKSYRFINDSKSVEWRPLRHLSASCCTWRKPSDQWHHPVPCGSIGLASSNELNQQLTDVWRDWVLHVSSASIALFSHRSHLIEANLPMDTWNLDDYDDYDLCLAWLWNLISNPCMLSDCYHLQLLIWVTWPNNGTWGSWGVKDFTRL